MTPKSTERPLPRTQVNRARQIDQEIYLRTYDVINSIDRGQNQPWWEKVLDKAKRAPAEDFNEVLPAARAAQRLLLTGEVTNAEELMIASPAALEGSNAPESKSGDQPKATGMLPARRVSWFLLALVAVISAGLTFALVRLAWAPISSGTGHGQPKHSATYVTTRSKILVPGAVS